MESSATSAAALVVMLAGAATASPALAPWPARLVEKPGDVRLETHMGRLTSKEFSGRPINTDPILAGRWKTGDTGPELRVKEWDISSVSTAAGPVRVVFRFLSGANRLNIEWVEVVVGDKTVARDEHPGVAGAKSQRNAYTVAIPAAGSGRILLRALIRSDGGSDSNGEVLLEPAR